MSTTRTDIPTPAHVNRQGFPLDHCHRCGGSGNYSYNAMHGSTCYGCGGTGFIIAAGARKAHGEYNEATRKAIRRTVDTLKPGDEICGFVGMSDKADGNWRTVATVTIHRDQCVGWSTLPDGTKVETGWRATVTFTDGSELATATHNLYRGRNNVDPAPFVAAALRGWKRSGCKGGAKPA